MNASNPYASPEMPLRFPARIRLRDQQIFRQLLLYSMFYFVGLALYICVNAGIRAVPKYLSDVMGDFTHVWLPELLFALVPYVVLRSFTIGRFVRPTWWSFCVAGVATFPFLNLYVNLLFSWTPSFWYIAAHVLCVVSAILMELLAIALFSKFRSQRKHAEQNDEPELPMTGF